MKRIKRRFWFFALVQFCIILALLVWRFYLAASYVIAHPNNADVYFVFTWSFQIMQFCIFWLIPALVAIGLLTCLEWFIVRSLFGKQVTNEKTLA